MFEVLLQKSVFMASRNDSSLRQSAGDRILTIDWRLLFARLRTRFTALFRSARHRAEQTEYTPPAWATNFRFSWFRLGLVAIAIFVFTQKQVDFTVSVGKLGVAAANNTTEVEKSTTTVTGSPRKVSNNAQMSVLPTLASNPAPASWSVMDIDEVAAQQYIDRFQRVAQTEEDKYQIPAAAKLAIAIYESEAGLSPKAREYNNHFGSVTANGYYANAWANWRAHSDLIAKEYGDLKAYAGSVENWISMLARTNYTTDPDYDTKLMAIVERFGLK
ncbi:hypothetical protein CEQ90_12820 [Lewinellaceae bacterium SD302]|nr:hypothetical protein CEQ90_12820 [Lewinellaceae bacterium SD302]